MFLSITDQVIILLAAIYGGFLLGFIFDSYRFIRDIFRLGKLITIIGDIVFWVLSLTLILLIVYGSNSGLIRVYQLLGFAIGVLVYFKFLSRIVQSLLNVLVHCLRSLIYSVLKLIRGPLTLILNILWRPYEKIKKSAAKLATKSGMYFQKRIPIFKNRK